MRPEAKKLRDRVSKLAKEFEEAQRGLDNLERTCRHQYGPTVYDPINHKAYTCPGDPPGTMGVDWRGPVHVPARTEKRWRRECDLCGKVEYTKQVKENITETPYWPENRRVVI
jgi:hypothetical protein